MADTSTTLVIDQTDALNVQGRTGKVLLRSIINHLRGLEGGNKRGRNIQVFADGTDPVAASATITLASCAAGTVIEVNGVPFTAMSGTATVANNEFDISGNDAADATALAAAINNSTHASISNIVTASASAAVVTVTADQKGALGNAVTLESLGVVATGTVTYSTSSGAQTVTINGVQVYNATGASDAANATAAAAAINASANALVSGHVRALARAGVVHIFAKYDGARGNAITLAATGTGATASGARLTGGTSANSEGAAASGTVTISSGSGAITITINGVEAASETWASSDNATAAALCADIQQSTDALVQGIVKATVSTNVITITALRGGVSGNAITLATAGTGSTASGARLASGAVPTTVVRSAARLGSGAGGDTAVTTITL